MKRLIFICVIFIFGFSICSAEIDIKNKSVTAWKRNHNITGTVNIPSALSGTLFINDQTISFQIINNSFYVPAIIDEGINTIYAKADSSGIEITSDTIKITLGYKLKPEVFAYADISGNNINLHVQVIENPDSSVLTFYWEQDSKNPLPLTINNSTDSVASFTIPQGSQSGEYYFNLYAIEPDGDTAKARTFVTVRLDGIYPFSIKNDYAAWIDSAIIYEITPYIFVNGQSDFDDIQNKIPEIAELGVTTIWLQPVFSTNNGGQGYDITNYFNVRSDLGTKDDLHELIYTAKQYGLHVLLDFVANHSSIHHPYAVASAAEGEDSYYWNFYQREEDTAPYSQHYQHYQGFINYFWDELPNLNYNNLEVQKWITEAAQYWIEEFDIDGYRFDAVWGVKARNPEFTKEFRLALKRIKPEILMLAEDKATHQHVFDERFDAAYNWAPEIDWVSHWVWQTDYNPYANSTIFNSGNQNTRANLLRNSLTNNGNGYSADTKILRFLENNDIFHFITHHGIERTRMAAALLFSLDGIPLIYNGQEIGAEGHPYNTEFIFYPGRSMDYDDVHGLFKYYSRLAEIRKSYSSLLSENISEISVSPSTYVYAFRRWDEEQNIFTVINMGSAEVFAQLNLPIAELNLDSAKTYYLTDLLSGSTQQGWPQELNSVSVQMERFSTQILLLADSIPTVVGVDNEFADNFPDDFNLQQNYPNPFNPSTQIKFSIGIQSFVTLKVFDVLGNEVAVLINEDKPAGTYDIQFSAGSLRDGTELASGIYLYQLNAGGKFLSKKMMLLK